eukprot:1005570-Pleurochrysis_carterae.AAC.4
MKRDWQQMSLDSIASLIGKLGNLKSEISEGVKRDVARQFKAANSRLDDRLQVVKRTLIEDLTREMEEVKAMAELKPRNGLGSHN